MNRAAVEYYKELFSRDELTSIRDRSSSDFPALSEEEVLLLECQVARDEIKGVLF